MNFRGANHVCEQAKLQASIERSPKLQKAEAAPTVIAAAPIVTQEMVAPKGPLLKSSHYETLQSAIDTPIELDAQTQPAFPISDHPSDRFSGPDCVSIDQAIEFYSNPPSATRLTSLRASHERDGYKPSVATSFCRSSPSEFAPQTSSPYRDGATSSSQTIEKDTREAARKSPKPRPPPLIMTSTRATPTASIDTALGGSSLPNSGRSFNTGGSITPKATPRVHGREKRLPRPTLTISPTSSLRSAPFQKSDRALLPSPPYFSPRTPAAMSIEVPIIYTSSPVGLFHQQDTENLWREEVRGRSKAQHVLQASHNPQVRAKSHSPPRSAHPDDEQHLDNYPLLMRRFLASSDSPITEPGSHDIWPVSTHSNYQGKGYVPAESSVNTKHAIIQSYFQKMEK
jgi:hypothetical protein